MSILCPLINTSSVAGQGTTYIRADGSIDPLSAPIQRSGDYYRLVDNLNMSSIVIERGNITLDGAGFTLQGDHTGAGINCSFMENVTIKNTNIQFFSPGITIVSSLNVSILANNITGNGNAIELSESSNNNIVGNEVDANQNGIFLSSCSNNSIIENYLSGSTYPGYAIDLSQSPNNDIGKNRITNNQYGIQLYNSRNNSVEENELTGNQVGVSLAGSSDNILSKNIMNANVNGLSLDQAPNNVFRNNSMADNDYNFNILEPVFGPSIEDLDVSNTVDGKPIYYWVDRRGMSVPPNAGFVALINSCNITVEGLQLTKNGLGILLDNTTDSRIMNNRITANEAYGAYLLYSSSNTIDRNNITDSRRGIQLFRSDNNNITGNRIAGQFERDTGIDLAVSSFNRIIGNVIVSNTWGIINLDDPDNEIYWNDFDNSVQVDTYNIGRSTWDGGFPRGGNFWSDYAGLDSNEDGFGDTPYVIDANTNNQDNYPLMTPYEYSWSSIVADVNNDSKVNMKDMGNCCAAFGSKPGDPRWNPNCDFNKDGVVNMIDVGIVYGNFGKHA